MRVPIELVWSYLGVEPFNVAPRLASGRRGLAFGLRLVRSRPLLEWFDPGLFDRAWRYPGVELQNERLTGGE